MANFYSVLDECQQRGGVSIPNGVDPQLQPGCSEGSDRLKPVLHRQVTGVQPVLHRARTMHVPRRRLPMSRVERIDPNDAQRRTQEARETQPNPRKISRTPGQAEGDEPTIDEALRNQERKS